MLVGLLMIITLGWGAAAFFNSENAKAHRTYKMVFWRPLLAIPLIGIPLLFGASLHPPLQLIVFAILSTSAVLIAASFSYAALKRGTSSEVVALSSTYPLVALILLAVFWGIFPSPTSLVGVVAVVAGIIMLNLKEGRIEIPHSRGPVVFSLAAALAWGAWSICDWQALQYGTPWDLLLWTDLIAVALQSGVYVWARRSGRALRPERKLLLLLALAIVLTQIATVAFYFALSSGDPNIVIAASAAYPLATQWILILLGRERLDFLRLLATGIIVAGVAAIQIAG